jgi:hypothetical protein
MRANDQYSDPEQGVSSNGYCSALTEPWVLDDAFMGTEGDHVSAHGDVSDNFPYQESIAGHNPTTYTDSSFLSMDSTFASGMCPDWDSTGDHSALLHGMCDFGADTSESAGPSSSNPHNIGANPSSSGPWDPIGTRRVTDYGSSFVAYLGSPDSYSSQSSDDPSSEREFPPQESVIHASLDADVEEFSRGSPTLANQVQLHWEEPSTMMHCPLRIREMTMRESNRVHRKGRQGPLGSQRAKEAHVIRKLGACWPCRVSKSKASPSHISSHGRASADDSSQCSPGSPCERCRDHQESFSPLTYRICCRFSFADHAFLYFPSMIFPSRLPAPAWLTTLF